MDGVVAREWLEMDGEKKLLGMSELGCADGCGQQMGGEKKPLQISELGCADSCGPRGCKGVAGNGRGEEAAGDERAWLCGRLRTAWVQGSGWKWVGRRKAAGDERAWLLGCADGCGRGGCKERWE